MVHKKDPVLLMEKTSPCSASSGFPLSLDEWSFTLYPTPYNHKLNVLSVLLNKTFSSFLPSFLDPVRWIGHWVEARLTRKEGTVLCNDALKTF